ncbi:polysaccharide pyruvyl transferase family protein [Ochrovirga pacifica]|uniref:polysaccharide pyruvyl transferase family protein n=1 Tax=Ochrovirga pacifica TaxID=1042376 RepID=UPI000255779D|nr:polysaccharide pyruvyl transferase family protein [Ochrovirga pacifica]
MKLITYESKKGNFGDDLNGWLWPKIFHKDALNEKDNIALLAIGSILIGNSDYIKKANQHQKKVIVGTGVRSIAEQLKFDESWDLTFFRGPFSSMVATGEPGNYISDSAYYLTLLKDYKQWKTAPKKYKVSVIPYYKSIDTIDWKSCCEQLGWNLIDPTGFDIEYFIKEVSQSEFVISEAMHGAIIADILRVPWQRLKYKAHLFEGEAVSEFKWHDWMYSINITNSNTIEVFEKKKKLKYKFFPHLYTKKNQARFKAMISKNFNKNSFSLSSDETLNTIIDKLKKNQAYLQKTYFSQHFKSN